MKLLKGFTCLVVFVTISVNAWAASGDYCTPSQAGTYTDSTGSSVYTQQQADDVLYYVNTKTCAQMSNSTESTETTTCGSYVAGGCSGIDASEALTLSAHGFTNISGGTKGILEATGISTVTTDNDLDKLKACATVTTSCSTCTPDCTGKSCGVSDGCGGTCGTATDNGCSCDDALYCNGTDTYSSGTCSSHTGDPCTSPATCNETTNTCDSSGQGSLQIFDGDPTCTTCDTSGGMIPLLISKISGANSTVDCQVYEFNHPQLKAALIAADQSGTTVRFVTDDDHSDPASLYYTSLQELSSGGVDVRYVNSGGIMHTKYCIFDGTDVFAGSMNFTEKGAGEQFNYGMAIDGSPDTVTAFQCNFNESWNYCGNGTNGSCAPSQRDTNCNDSSINVGGTPVEICFSPNGSCMSRLRGTATHTSGYTGTCASNPCQSGEFCFDYKYNNGTTVEDRHACDACNATGSIVGGATTRQAVSAFFFTDACLAKTMVDSSAPINYCMFDALGALNAYSQDNYLCSQGVNCFIEDLDGKNHSKVLVADNTVVIGSMNFSMNGDSNNDEQTVIVHNATLASQVYNDIGSDIADLDVRINACVQQSTENCTDGYDNTGSPPGIDYCDYSCNCTNPAADCLSCLDAPGTGGGEEPPIGGGVVDCNVEPTNPECTGTGTGAPVGYSCTTTCVDSRDGSCYCQSTNSAAACYDSSCDPSTAALTCADMGSGQYKCTSSGQIASGDLRAASVTFVRRGGEVHTNTKWYALDGAGLVYESMWCESPHPYTNNCGYGESGCVNDAMYFCQAYRSNATKIAVWFASVDTESCKCNGSTCNSNGNYECLFDYVDLKNSNNTHVAYYGGPYTVDAYYYGWSTWVTGTTANLYLDTDSINTDWGFAVSAVVYQPPSSDGGTANVGAGGALAGEACTTNADCATGLSCKYSNKLKKNICM